MDISIIGLGYVGLTNALYLGKHHTVHGYDIDYGKVDALQNDEVYLGEDGLQAYLTRYKKAYHFYHDLDQCITNSSVIIIAVPTPEAKDGTCDLTALMDVVQSIAPFAIEHAILLIRSTVIPGTNQKVKDMLQSLNRADIRVVSMPEFLALGTAMKDMEHPSRLVIGTNHLNVVEVIKDMYRYDERTPYVVSDPQTAEFIKYASNALLATKVSFINEMSQISEAIGANISTVLDGLSLDPRIGKHFLQPGLGFGGSCFPKDLKALKLLANDHHLDGLLLEATLKANKDQTRRFTERVLSRFKGNIEGKKIAVLGLSYKGATADVRNSPAFTVIDMLTDKKAIIFAYDKRSTIEFFECRGEKPCLAYANVIEDALIDAECAIIINDAEEIKALSAEDFKRLMKTPIVFDGKNLFDVDNMKTIEYHSVGRTSTR